MSDISKLLKFLPPETELPVGFSDERLLRWMCQRSFLAFCMAVKPDFIPTKFHIYLAEKFQQIYEDTKNKIDRRYIIACPPQLGKSTITTQLFPAWVLGRENWPVICASYSADLAERNSMFCREFLNSDTYKIIFPRTRLNPDSTSKSYWQTNRGGAYRAVGTMGGLTGYSARILLADDLLSSQADAESATISDGVWSWFKTVFYTRKQSKSAMVLIATRWSLNDPTGRLIDQQQMYKGLNLAAGSYDKWDYLSFPAIAEADEDFGDGWTRKAGEVICPERFTLEDMVKTRNSLVSEGKVQEWSSLYQQEPILQENAEFKNEWFRYFEEKDIAHKELTYITMVDLAISQAKAADNTVVRTIAVERNTGYWYLMEETAGHLDPLETVDAIFFHAKTYRSHVWIESVAYQAALPKFILEKQRKDRVYFNVDELKHAKGKSKEARIRGLIARYKAGTIFHRRSDTALQVELLQFPKGRHDDRIDCLAFALEVADGAMPSETPKEKEKREKEEKVDFDPFASISKI
jgi:hypothetical protein